MNRGVEEAEAIVADGQAQPYLHPSLACFILLAKFLGVPADPAQIDHQRGKGDEPYSLEDLARIAKQLGLIARLRTASRADLPKLPLPALAGCVDGDAVILLKIEDESVNPRYLVQRGNAERPEVWSAADATERFSGRALRGACQSKGLRSFALLAITLAGAAYARADLHRFEAHHCPGP
jgi:ABC-type bacteriocin/lantibiotic exporter with double-glycine peptidase domain